MIKELLQQVRSAMARVSFHGGHLFWFKPHPKIERHPNALVGSAVRPPAMAAQAGSRPARVLQIDGDDTFAALFRSTLNATLQAQCDVERVTSLAEGLEQLVEQAYDLIVVEPSLSDSHGAATVASLRPYADESPIVVLTSEEDASQALATLEQGAQDYYFKSAFDPQELARSIREAMARHPRAPVDFDKQRARESVQRSQEALHRLPDPADRREHPRYLLTRPLLAIPVLPDGKPLAAFPSEGFSLDLSASGLRCEIAGLSELPSRRLVVGLETANGDPHFATLEVRWTEPCPGGLRIGGEFAQADRELLRQENLAPQLNPSTYRYQTGLPVETLHRWVDLGICRPVLVDRILVCPDCRAVPTMRYGCRACGCVRTASSQLIHHFPCAHVGLVDEFETQQELVCPKCRQRSLIVGSDFEYLRGPYHCLDCNWSDTELECVGQCLACDVRFPIHQAVEEELYGYYVHRLDPLALVSEPR